MKQSLHDIFRGNVDRELVRRGWNQADLAKTMGMKSAQLSRYLTGKNSPTFSILERMSSAFGIAPSRLLAGPEDQPNLKDALRQVRSVLQCLETADDADVMRILEQTKRK